MQQTNCGVIFHGGKWLVHIYVQPTMSPSHPKNGHSCCQSLSKLKLMVLLSNCIEIVVIIYSNTPGPLHSSVYVERADCNDLLHRCFLFGWKEFLTLTFRSLKSKGRARLQLLLNVSSILVPTISIGSVM